MAPMYSSAVLTAAGIMWSSCNHMHLLLEWRSVTDIVSVCKTVQYYVSTYKNRICLLIPAGHNYSDSKD